MERTKSIYVAVFIFLFLLIVLAVPQLITNYWWFESLGVSQIFIINIEAFLLIFLVSALLFFVFCMLNLWISSSKGVFFTTKLKIIVTTVIALMVGRLVSMEWLTVLKFFRQTPFGVQDPVFLKDISFYVFTLPFLELLWMFAIITLLITALLVIFNYFQTFIVNAFRSSMEQESVDHLSRKFNLKKEFRKLKNKTLIHISVLVSLFFLLLAFKHYLDRFSILFTSTGAVDGASYTDIHVTLPALIVLIVFAIALALVSFLMISKKRKFLTYGIVFYFLVFIIGLVIVPPIMQSLYVSPNEFTFEKQYIEDNINYTRMAYNLQAEEEFMDFNRGITKEMVENNPETINNIRLLDWRPLRETYRQTQQIRLYYDLSSIDIDRYMIGGNYTQVMLSAREIDQTMLRERAQTWVNRHMIYTHGYGAVMSPVSRVTEDGLPDYLIQDIPPKYTVEDENIKIKRPELYYGEKDIDFVLVNTKTEEFNYPKRDENVYTHYDGDGGVKLDSFLKEFLMALKFREIKLLTTDELTSESRIMYTRNIQDRINKVTPFLSLDNDPYQVIADGKMYWIQDAYTTTHRYPYSESMGGINYIRNSVKIVMDAYTGDLTYYMMDNCPIMETYSNIYPGQFKHINDMPDYLEEHIRYPVDLFNIQAELFKTYHMTNPRVYYNKEDTWEIPTEIYAGQRTKLEPYYVILSLPGEDDEEFVLMTTFTPATRNNMASWLGARSDGDNYGELVLYRFPKDRIAYGPSQIEAMIDQDTKISEQLTLWSRMGSTVIRGNLLVIPIENSVLYVEPLYLQADEGKLPQLQRVIVSDGTRVVMGENLEHALEGLFVERKIPEIEPDEERTPFELIEEAQKYHGNILTSMEQKNWTGIGKNIDELGSTLEKLN
ncbi:MAG: UPF0182 family protein [Candidatus Nanoarchaeia archaeon]